MSAVLDDEVGFDEPTIEQQPKAVGDRNAMAITNDMTRVQTALSEFDRVSAGLAELEARYPKDAVYEIGTTKGMKDAIEHRAAWRDPRITVEKARKMAKAPLLALGKSVDARASWLTEKLREGEEPIDQLIKAEEARKEEERQAKINAEAGRILAIQEALAEIAQNVLIACGKKSADILALLDQMRSTSPDQLVFQEMIEQARAAWSNGIAKLETAHKAKLWDEEQEAERARAEAERKRRQEAEDAERVRIAQAQAAEAERLARVAAEQAAQHAAQLQVMSINAQVMGCMGKSSADIGMALDLLKATSYPEDAAETVLAAHEAAKVQLAAMLQISQQQEATAKQLADLQAAPRKEAVARMAFCFDKARGRVGQDLPYDVYLRFAGGHGEQVPLENVDEYIAALNALQPAPVVEIQAPPVAPVADGSQDSDSGAANPAVETGQSNGMAAQALVMGSTVASGAVPPDASIETSEADAVEPPREVVLAAMEAGIDEVQRLLRDTLTLVEFLRAPYSGKFPTQPKVGTEWWASLKAQLDAIEPRLQYVVGIPAGEA